MKKLLRIVSAAAAMLLAAGTFAACGGDGGSSEGGKPSTDGKTLNIRVYKSGYGDAYVSNWIYEFENIYKDEGYKVNIVDSTENLEGSVVTNEMILGAKNTVDLYIAGNVTPNALKVASDGEEMDMIAAKLNDVYDSFPVKADGTEESVKIKDKLMAGFDKYFMLGDDYYTFAFRSSPVGLVVNPVVFPEGKEYPRTTDELLALCAEIRAIDGLYPFAYAGYNANSYLYGMEDVWVAQYSGTDYYADFCAMNYSVPSEAYELYKNEGWVKSLDVIKKIQSGATGEKYNFANGVSSKANQAQHNLLTNKAVFMCVGQQLQNEMYTNYAEATKKMIMLKVPVLSAVKEKCTTIADDNELSSLVKAIDEGKTELAGDGYDVNEKDFETVKAARNVVYDWGAPHSIVLNAYSSKLNIAKLFLRYIASDDAAKSAYNANTSMSCYTVASSVDYSSMRTDSAFLLSSSKITDGASLIYRMPLGNRTKYSMNIFNQRADVEKQFYSDESLTAEKVMNDEYIKAKSLWEQRFKG